MVLSIIVGATDNNVISKNGLIPWKMPADFAYVRKKTWGHPIIMGRGTHDHVGKTLTGRINIVVSSNPDYKVAEGSILVSSVEDALQLPQVKNVTEAFIFGGEGIYNSAMPYVQKIYLTRIHTQIDGDRFFNYDKSQWHEVSKEKHQKDKDNPYDYDFIVLERV